MSPVAQLAFVVLIVYLILRVTANLLQAVRRDALSEQEGREIEDDEPIMRKVSGKTYHQVWHVGRQGRDEQQEGDVEEARWRDV